MRRIETRQHTVSLAAAIAGLTLALAAGVYLWLSVGSDTSAADRNPEVPQRLVVGVDGSTNDVLREAVELVGFDVVAPDVSALGLYAGVVSTVPGLPRPSNVPPVVNRNTLEVRYYDSSFDPSDAPSYEGLRVAITFKLGLSRVGLTTDDDGRPLYRIDGLEFDIEGFELTRVTDLIHDGASVVYVLSGHERTFEVMLSSAPLRSKSPLPGDEDIFPLLRELALSVSD
jgi:hypothetical protein